jgi:hypothetical protein
MQEDIHSLLAYSTFNDEGHKEIPSWLFEHPCKFCLCCLNDLRHKALLVAGRHLTDPNTTDSKYSSVIALRSMQISIAAGELNNQFIMVGEIASAYQEAFTLEKVCFIAGPELGPLAIHFLTIVHALYGLRTSGPRWHDRFSDVKHLLGFSPSKADPDVCA